MLNKKPIALIQLSGGIDSTYVLYQWLMDNPDELILVHHIDLINHERRHKREQIAVDKILYWLKDHGLDNFTYIKSTFDYGGIGSIIKDVEVCNFFIGIILRSNKWNAIRSVLMPIYKRENVLRQTRANRLRKLVSNDSIEEEKYGVTVLYPIENKTKQEVMALMPEDLLKLCWYCRYGSSKPCGKCITCVEVNKSKPKN